VPFVDILVFKVFGLPANTGAYEGIVCLFEGECGNRLSLNNLSTMKITNDLLPNQIMDKIVVITVFSSQLFWKRPSK